MLSRHKPHPCRQVPAIFKVGSITNSGNDCRCSLWADTTYLGDTLANVALAEDGFNLLIEVSDLSLSWRGKAWRVPMISRVSSVISIAGLLMISGIVR
jgi:hypothetical protein